MNYDISLFNFILEQLGGRAQFGEYHLMLIRFWGTRGSLAKPGPDTLRYGGNTSCIEVRSASGTLVVIDCGTGAHALGHALMTGPVQPVNGHLLISHTHWDHIQGIPFFAPLFVPGNEWNIYAPHSLGQSIQETLAGQMQYTYFPVTLEALGAKIKYNDLLEGVFKVGDITVRTRYLNHPALTLGYRLEADGVSVVYSCDHEPLSRQPSSEKTEIGEQDRRHADFLRGADLVIHDAQYTATEYANKIGWGHSTAEYASEICSFAGVRQLALTHHDPMRSDDAVDEIVDSVKRRLRQAGSSLKVFAAAEGQTIELAAEARARKSSSVVEFSSVTAIAPSLKLKSVLLNATDAATEKIIAKAAAAEGIRLTATTNIRDALKCLDEDHPALVIVDGTSANDDTLTLCRRTKEPATRDSPQVPIVVIADRENDAGDLTTFATDWMIRPFTEQYARTRIRAWILRTTCRWIRAQVPENEELRQRALETLQILDTAPEERYDRITRIAREVFDVPIALISLIDRERQWFKSCAGLSSSETSRDQAFCAHAILQDEVLIVPDALLDTRFADNPLVTGEPRVRFYAGCPLREPNGHLIGTLCIIDARPRQLDKAMVGLLKDLAILVEREISSNPGPLNT